MKKFKEMIGKNPMAWFLMVLLLISVAGNVAQQAYIQEHNPNMMKIVGTYITGDPSDPYPYNEYMVFENGNKNSEAMKRYVYYHRAGFLIRESILIAERGLCLWKVRIRKIRGGLYRNWARYTGFGMMEN